MNERLEVEVTHEEIRSDSRTLFGFWMYLMTDCVLFASLFATFAVLRGAAAGLAAPPGVFDLSFVLEETLILLSSSFTCGMAILSARAGFKRGTLAWLCATFVLGALFVGLELSEFMRLAAQGNGPSHNAFFSSYFTLVGTHGLHVTAGLIWMLVLGIRIGQFGLTRANLRKLTLLALFWHFLDIIWIFIFTIVYLTGSI